MQYDRFKMLLVQTNCKYQEIKSKTQFKIGLLRKVAKETNIQKSPYNKDKMDMHMFVNVHRSFTLLIVTCERFVIKKQFLLL